MGFSRQEYWSGLPCPSPGDLPNPGIETAPLTSPALAGRFFPTSATWDLSLKSWNSQGLPQWSSGCNSALLQRVLVRSLLGTPGSYIPPLWQNRNEKNGILTTLPWALFSSSFVIFPWATSSIPIYGNLQWCISCPDTSPELHTNIPIYVHNLSAGVAWALYPHLT